MELTTYRRFGDQETADAFAIILNDNGIAFEIENEDNSIDSLYIGDKQFITPFSLKISAEDFAKVDAIVAQTTASELEQDNTGHYLYEFTNEELIDLVSKPDEWNAFDYQLAQKILSERGKNINPQIISSLKTQRLQDLAQPEKSETFWIIIGYASAFIGGPLGILMGWYLATLKKTLPNGQKVFVYTKEDRQHGTRIWIIGLIIFFIFIIVKFSGLQLDFWNE